MGAVRERIVTYPTLACTAHWHLPNSCCHTLPLFPERSTLLSTLRSACGWFKFEFAGMVVQYGVAAHYVANSAAGGAVAETSGRAGEGEGGWLARAADHMRSAELRECLEHVVGMPLLLLRLHHRPALTLSCTHPPSFRTRHKSSIR